MDSATFSGLFGALSTEHRMNYISNNLANADTTGYKKDHLAFRDTMIQFAHDQIMEPIATVRSKKLFPEPHIASRVRLAVAKTDYAQGSLKATGNPLDVAITGEGFLKVQSPEGEFVTRNGSLCQTSDGTLTTKQGWPVLGEGGPITVPPGTKNVYISPDARVFADDAEIGTLQVVTFSDLNGLEKIGGNLYRVREGSTSAEVIPEPGSFLANQGFLEAANVNVVEEMVNMIETNRMFDALQKVMQTGNALDRESYGKVGRSVR